jgi:hypothetical protein
MSRTSRIVKLIAWCTGAGVIVLFSLSGCGSQPAGEADRRQQMLDEQKRGGSKAPGAPAK